MNFQDLMIIIQTSVGVVSLIVSLITLNKVSKITIKSKDSHNKQVAIGSKIKQKNQ